MTTKITEATILPLISDWRSGTFLCIQLKLMKRQDPARVGAVLWRLQRKGFAKVRKSEASGADQFCSTAAGRRSISKRR